MYLSRQAEFEGTSNIYKAAGSSRATGVSQKKRYPHESEKKYHGLIVVELVINFLEQK
jgi:hypothetical protein